MIDRDEDAWADATDCPVCGRESCAEHLEPATNGADPHEAPRPRLAVRASEYLLRPAPAAIVADVLYADCLTVLAAESGAGKTFVALDIAGAIAHGVPWHGRRVRRGSVVYVAFEGLSGLRLRALRDVTGHPLDRLHVLSMTAALSPRLAREGEIPSRGEAQLRAELEAIAAELVAAGEPPIAGVMVDTVRASMTGSEDSSESVAAYLGAVRRGMAVTPGAGWLLVHHAGWQDGEAPRKRERGSSSWRGASDVTLYLAAGEYDRETGTCPLVLETRKARDGETPAPLRLVRRRVTLDGFDADGQPSTSCVIERDARSRADVEAEQHAATREAERALDVAVLRAMQAGSLNIKQIRERLGAKYDAVHAAVARVLSAEWARPGKRGQPYTLTPAGLDQL